MPPVPEDPDPPGEDWATEGVPEIDWERVRVRREEMRAEVEALAQRFDELADHMRRKLAEDHHARMKGIAIRAVENMLRPKPRIDPPSDGCAGVGARLPTNPPSPLAGADAKPSPLD